MVIVIIIAAVSKSNPKIDFRLRGKYVPLGWGCEGASWRARGFCGRWDVSGIEVGCWLPAMAEASIIMYFPLLRFRLLFLP